MKPSELSPNKILSDADSAPTLAPIILFSDDCSYAMIVGSERTYEGIPETN